MQQLDFVLPIAAANALALVSVAPGEGGDGGGRPETLRAFSFASLARSRFAFIRAASRSFASADSAGTREEAAAAPRARTFVPATPFMKSIRLETVRSPCNRKCID